MVQKRREETDKQDRQGGKWNEISHGFTVYIFLSGILRFSCCLAGKLSGRGGRITLVTFLALQIKQQIVLGVFKREYYF